MRVRALPGGEDEVAVHDGRYAMSTALAASEAGEFVAGLGGGRYASRPGVSLREVSLLEYQREYGHIIAPRSRTWRCRRRPCVTAAMSPTKKAGAAGKAPHKVFGIAGLRQEGDMDIKRIARRISAAGRDADDLREDILRQLNAFGQRLSDAGADIGRVLGDLGESVDQWQTAAGASRGGRTPGEQGEAAARGDLGRDAILDEAMAIAKGAPNMESGFELAQEFLAKRGVEFHGVERVEENGSGKELSYLNAGDTYDTTLCCEGDGDEWFVGSWGGWLEETEGKHSEEEGEVKCGWCGEWTSTDGQDWHDVSCQSCGHMVDGGN